ncbi:MAG: YlmC/YmxH family sporulation protein [Clostridiales bacterium]|jgi:YlmC/YmxH family sporulation protein|nr:YlmC/YmxH family sporulation protein [Clostridiales bacterium]
MNGVKMDISFCELRCKDVVNACDGRKMGRIIDIVFCPETGVIRGIVTPFQRRLFFSKAQEIFIPWRCIKKLGEDVIIVDIRSMDGRPDRGFDRGGYDYDDGPPPAEACAPPGRDGEDARGQPGDVPACDHRCDKCMLFDCAYRWKKGNA